MNTTVGTSTTEGVYRGVRFVRVADTFFLNPASDIARLRSRNFFRIRIFSVKLKDASFSRILWLPIYFP